MCHLFSIKQQELWMKPGCLDSVKIVAMVSFIAKKGGHVDWLLFSKTFRCVKAKHVSKFFDLKKNGEVLEVWNNEATQRFAQVQCKNQAKNKIDASASLPLSVPWATQRHSDDGAGKSSILHKSKVLTPAILSTEPIESLVVLCIPSPLHKSAAGVFIKTHCYSFYCIL